MDESGSTDGYFPESGLLFRGGQEARYERFAELRESLMYDLADSGVRTATLMAYWGDLDSLLWWCLQEDVDVLAPATTDIARFLDGLRQRRYSLNTVARHITTFRRFYGFLVDVEEIQSSPVVGIHQRRPRPRPRLPTAMPLTARQRGRMIEAVADARDRAVLSLLFDRLSVAQLCAAGVADLANGRPATLATTHRGIPETATLTDDTASAVWGYLDGRGTGPLILTADDRPLDRFGVNRILTRVAKRAGIRTPVGPARLPQRVSRAPRASRHTSTAD